MLRWMAAEYPGAAGYWPAQAVANAALCGTGAIDSVTAMTTLPAFDYVGWDATVCDVGGCRCRPASRDRVREDPAGA